MVFSSSKVRGIKGGTTGVILFLASIGAANAIPIVDEYNPEPDVSLNAAHPLFEFTHTITDGFDAKVDTIVSAKISVHLMDGGGTENIGIAIDGMAVPIGHGTGDNDNSGRVQIGDSAKFVIQLSDELLGRLARDGELVVSIQSLDMPDHGNGLNAPKGPGEFVFADSVLTVAVDKGRANLTPDTAPSRVPEPATVALLGLGVMGIGYQRRKKVA